MFLALPCHPALAWPHFFIQHTASLLCFSIKYMLQVANIPLNIYSCSVCSLAPNLTIPTLTRYMDKNVNLRLTCRLSPSQKKAQQNSTCCITHSNAMLTVSGAELKGSRTKSCVIEGAHTKHTGT